MVVAGENPSRMLGVLREGVGKRRRHAADFASANLPRSALMNRLASPLVLISRKIEAYTAWTMLAKAG